MFQRELTEAVRTRTSMGPRTPQDSQPRPGIAILYSGGLDCSVLARLADEVVDKDQSIDLLNVAFENPRRVKGEPSQATSTPCTSSPFESCPDRITGRSSYQELCCLCPGRQWNFVKIVRDPRWLLLTSAATAS